MKTRYLAGLTIAATALLAGCGGGSPGSSVPTIPGAGGSAQSLGLTLSGSGLPLSSARRTASLDGSPVTVTYQGQTVATGTLNGFGFAQLHFTAPAPLGATVTITVGSGASAITATVVLASSVGATAVNIVYTPASGGTPAKITVHSAADRDGNGEVDGNDDEQETSTENPQDGELEDVDSADNDHLPANLPITISVCNASTITIAPLPTAIPTAPAPAASVSPAPSATPLGALTLRIAERASDGDAGTFFSYVASPFSQPLTFPIVSAAARIDIEVDANGEKLVTIEAPLAAFTGAASTQGSPTPATCPTLSPGLPVASPAPTASPVASSTPAASPSPTATPI